MRNERIPSKRVLSTNQHLSDVARFYLVNLEQRMQNRPIEVLEAWPQIAGTFARMTRANKFEKGILYVLVGNSTLLSVIHQKKNSLLFALREKIHKVQIVDIVFRFG